MEKHGFGWKPVTLGQLRELGDRTTKPRRTAKHPTSFIGFGGARFGNPDWQSTPSVCAGSGACKCLDRRVPLQLNYIHIFPKGTSPPTMKSPRSSRTRRKARKENFRKNLADHTQGVRAQMRSTARRFDERDFRLTRAALSRLPERSRKKCRIPAGWRFLFPAASCCKNQKRFSPARCFARKGCLPETHLLASWILGPKPPGRRGIARSSRWPGFFRMRTGSGSWSMFRGISWG